MGWSRGRSAAALRPVVWMCENSAEDFWSQRRGCCLTHASVAAAGQLLAGALGTRARSSTMPAWPIPPGATHAGGRSSESCAQLGRSQPARSSGCSRCRPAAGRGCCCEGWRGCKWWGAGRAATRLRAAGGVRGGKIPTTGCGVRGEGATGWWVWWCEGLLELMLPFVP